MQPVALPTLLKRDHAGNAAGHLLPQPAEALLDAPPGLWFPKLVRNVNRYRSCHNVLLGS